MNRSNIRSIILLRALACHLCIECVVCRRRELRLVARAFEREQDADAAGRDAEICQVTDMAFASGRRTFVEEDGLVGMLFEPAGRPRSTVLTLGGSEGGIDERLGASLAEAGFVALALAYFGADALPAELIEVPVETVGHALDWLRSRTRCERVAVIGGSKGGELALLAASLYPERVSAVVGLAASVVVWQGIPAERRDWGRPKSSWSVDGEPIDFLPFARPGLAAILRGAGALLLRRPLALHDVYDRALDDHAAVARTLIPVERIDAPILLVSGTDDRLWPSTRLAELAMRRLAGHDRPARAHHLCYDGAGHLAGQPPIGDPGGRLALGGTPAADAASHADAWPRILDVLASAG